MGPSGVSAESCLTPWPTWHTSMSVLSYRLDDVVRAVENTVLREISANMAQCPLGRLATGLGVDCETAAHGAAFISC